MKRLILVAGLSLLSVTVLQAQDEDSDKKSFWDIFRIKTPEKLEYVAPDTQKVLLDEQDIPEDDTINLQQELSVVHRDTVEKPSGKEGLQLVEVAEEVKVDCVWIKLEEYYSIWDTKNVNPYDIDGASFKDTLELELFNKPGDWAMPITGTHVTSDFGKRWYRWHYGTDLRLSRGDTVRAAFDGIVRISKINPGGYGYYVMLRHKNGLETLYGHLKKPGLPVGTEVEAGEMIGLGGNSGHSSGAHLHFEVRYQGNAIDPQDMYNFVRDTIKQRIFTITPKRFAYLKEARKAIFHRVRKGDNLTRISHKYRVPIWKICNLNGISRNHTLHIGEKLRVR